jgi:hypothetical protein
LDVVLIYVIPVAGVVLAVAGTWYARWSGGPAVREERRQQSREGFRAVRRWMSEAPAITAAARLCIGLTWEHREQLGI